MTAAAEVTEVSLNSTSSQQGGKNTTGNLNGRSVSHVSPNGIDNWQLLQKEKDTMLMTAHSISLITAFLPFATGLALCVFADDYEAPDLFRFLGGAQIFQGGMSILAILIVLVCQSVLTRENRGEDGKPESNSGAKQQTAP